jgi:hypothetical protein
MIFVSVNEPFIPDVFGQNYQRLEPAFSKLAASLRTFLLIVKD